MAVPRSFKLAASLSLVLALACGQARNTPEQALESLMTALKDQRWELLYDILPEDEQKHWDAQVEAVLVQNEQERQQAAQLRKLGLDIGQTGDLLKELGVTREQWQGLPQREKFARMFGRDAKLNLGDLGVNPDFILGATIRSKSLFGDRAEIVVDDGKGHRSKLAFKLQGEFWRFQLSGEDG